MQQKELPDFPVLNVMLLIFVLWLWFWFSRTWLLKAYEIKKILKSCPKKSVHWLTTCLNCLIFEFSVRPQQLITAWEQYGNWEGWDEFPLTCPSTDSKIEAKLLMSKRQRQYVQLWMLSLQADFWLVLYCCSLLFFYLKFIETEKDNLCLQEEKK